MRVEDLFALTLERLGGPVLAERPEAGEQTQPQVRVRIGAERPLGELHRIFTAVLAKPVDIQVLVDLLDRLMPPRPKRDRDAPRS